MSGPTLLHETRVPGPVAGVDEAGRGPLAGPVVAAAVILPATGAPDGVDDSKRLGRRVRERLAAEIRACAQVGLGLAGLDEIERLNIHWATMLAMARAVDALPVRPGHVLVDGRLLPRWNHAATGLVRGDRLSLSVAAASVVAKVERDRIMAEAAVAHPQYGWDRNKGYPSPEHLRALARHGPTPLHRRTFAPVARAYAARVSPCRNTTSA